ncbi:MAG: DUF202 domain-containing protein [Acidimicrobiales bacterium]
MPTDPVPGLDGEWDEGLAPERTQLAWGRTGLAVVVVVGVLARRVWTLNGAVGVVGLVIVALGTLVWLAGMHESHRLEAGMVPHGLTGDRAFRLVTAGTVLLAAGGLVFGALLAS